MSFPNESITCESERLQSGLIFDAEKITLSAHYADQVTAYRSRREWFNLLSSFFLLESERDYEIRVESLLEINKFTLFCEFTSACGRYAFWRLLNHQAPEAEQKLCSHTAKGESLTFFSKIRGENQETRSPMILSESEENKTQRSTSEQQKAMLKRLLGLFQ